MIFLVFKALIALLPSLALGLPQPSSLQVRGTDPTTLTNYPSYDTSPNNKKRDVIYDLTISNCPCEGDKTTSCLGYHYELAEEADKSTHSHPRSSQSQRLFPSVFQDSRGDEHGFDGETTNASISLLEALHLPKSIN